MPLGLPVALLLAQAAAPAATPEAPAPQTTAANLGTADPCSTRPSRPDPNRREIVICAEKPQGYRIDPDIMTARRLKKSGGRPTKPGPGAIKDTSRCVVGPAGCQTAGVNLIGAALTAAEMAQRLAAGKEIGSMFVTDPQPSEFQLYQMAKAEREAAEAQKAGQAAAKAAAARPAPGPEPTKDSAGTAQQER
jgi:hypothetical protein